MRAKLCATSSLGLFFALVVFMLGFVACNELDVLLVAIAALRCELDEAFGFGCRRVSTMAARYPGGGARYARHRAHRRASNMRRIRTGHVVFAGSSDLVFASL
eukprot:s512_g7.t1